MKKLLELLDKCEGRFLKRVTYKGRHPTAFANVEVNCHYNGSGERAFGGHNHWPHVGMSVNLPADVSKAKADTLIRDLHLVLVRHGFKAE